MSIDAAEAAQAVDEWLVEGLEREPLHLAIEFIAPVDLVLEERQVFGKHEAVLGREDTGLEELADPDEVPLGPVGAAAEDEASAPQELQNVVARLQDLPLEGLAAANEIADLLLGLGRDMDEDELAGAVEAPELGGVTLIVLAVLSWTRGDQGRSGQFALVAPGGHVRDALSTIEDLEPLKAAVREGLRAAGGESNALNTINKSQVKEHDAPVRNQRF